MPKEIAGETFYNVVELAQELDVTPQTVRAYIKQGRLKGTRIGRPILVKEKEVKKFIETE